MSCESVRLSVGLSYVFPSTGVRGCVALSPSFLSFAQSHVWGHPGFISAQLQSLWPEGTTARPGSA